MIKLRARTPLMNQLEYFLDRQIKIKTTESVYLGALKEIDDENGTLVIQQKNISELKIVPFNEIVSCELSDSVSHDTHDPAIVQAGECIEYHEKTNFFSEMPEKYLPNFVKMTTEQKRNLIKDNYEHFGPKKDVTSYISAIYTVNYLRNRFLKDIYNKKICIVIMKTDWFSQVGFNISRVLLSYGYDPELITTMPVNQYTVRYIFYSKKERQVKKDELKGEYDLAIVACDNTRYINQEDFKAKDYVFIGIPKDHSSIQNKTGIFYGGFDMRYDEFSGDLVYVQSGLSRKTQLRMGLDNCPYLGYINYSK